MTRAPDDGLLKLADALRIVESAKYSKEEDGDISAWNAACEHIEEGLRASAQRSGVDEGPRCDRCHEPLLRHKHRDAENCIVAAPVPLSRCEVRSEEATCACLRPGGDPLGNCEICANRDNNSPIMVGGVRYPGKLKLVYIKRWRTLIPVPETYADEIVAALATRPADTSERKTFTIPDGYEAVRDAEGRATGEVRPITKSAPPLVASHNSGERLPSSDAAEGGADTVADTSEREVSWRCFHCDETFTDHKLAQDHFGFEPILKPACIDPLRGDEREMNARAVGYERSWREALKQRDEAWAKLAALPASSRESGSAAQASWQPIATAAKNGEPVLIYVPINTPDRRILTAYWTDAGWWICSGSVVLGKPTLWMPLPTPSVASAEGKSHG